MTHQINPSVAFCNACGAVAMKARSQHIRERLTHISTLVFTQSLGIEWPANVALGSFGGIAEAFGRCLLSPITDSACGGLWVYALVTNKGTLSLTSVTISVTN